MPSRQDIGIVAEEYLGWTSALAGPWPEGQRCYRIHALQTDVLGTKMDTDEVLSSSGYSVGFGDCKSPGQVDYCDPVEAAYLFAPSCVLETLYLVHVGALSLHKAGSVM